MIEIGYVKARHLKRAGITGFEKVKVRSTCYRCGGNGWFPTPAHGACFRCGGDGKDPRHFDTKLRFADPAMEAEAAAMDAEVGHGIRAIDFLVRLATEAAAEAAHAARAAETIAAATSLPGWDLMVAWANGWKGGSGADEMDVWQIRAINRGEADKVSISIAELAKRGALLLARKAEADAKLAAGIRCPSGRVTVEGTVATTKEVTSQWGTSTKCLIVSDEGWKCWGSLPKGADKGDKVRFSATVEAKADDPLFGFYSRPTKVEILVSAAAPAEAGA